MNAADKKEFINDFCNAMRDAALSKADAMPDEWDGHELRLYLAEKFQFEVSTSMRDKRQQRAKNYTNAVITLNL